MSLSKQCLLSLPLLMTGLTGCSSLNTWNRSPLPPSPYAGTIDSGSEIMSTPHIDSVRVLDPWGMLFLPILAVDFVGSAAADTLVLPVTLIGEADRQLRTESY